MAMMVGEVVGNSIRGLEHNLNCVIAEMQEFVTHCEKTYCLPLVEEGTIASKAIVLMATRLYRFLDELEKYGIFNMGANEIAAAVMDAEEHIADQLKEWMHRKSMTVTEACQKFNRSRSTIYRWIKAGKLDARKNGRRWAILVD